MTLATRWEVERALYKSQLETAAKFVLIFVLSKSRQADAYVEPEHAPTFDEIAEATGYSRSTVAEWIRAVTDAKWIERDTAAARAKAGYQFRIGETTAEKPARNRRGKPKDDFSPPGGPNPSTSDGAEADGVAPRDTLFDPPGGPDQSAERTEDSPPGGPNDDAPIRKNSPTESSTTNSTSNAATATQPPSDSKPKRTKRAKVSNEDRADVEHVCNAFVAWRVKLGCKPPTITQEWRDEARRMIDLDKRSMDKIRDVMAWSQQHHFWCSNVKSIPKFREQFDTLRLQMEGRDRQPRSSERDFKVSNTHELDYANDF